MVTRLALTLLLLIIVPACTPADPTTPVADRDAPAREAESHALHTAFYQVAEAAEAAGAGATNAKTQPTDADAGPELTPPAVDRMSQLLDAVEQLHARVDELQNQNKQILAALGVDDQQPAPPPPAGSLAEKVLDLQEAVELLAANDEALRQAIADETITMKPALPSLANQGKLTVENNTDSDRQMWINGTSYWIWAGSKLTVQVPVGEVTTKVTGEDARTWTIGEPNFEERIEIVRRSQATPSAE